MQRIELRKVIDPLPIYTMWLREMKRFVRIKARIVGSLSMPFLILVFLGLPMRSVLVEDIDFLSFLAPGIVGMTLLFSATMAGASILWDKEFGFLKEVLVAPVNRFSVMLGRSLGGITITTIQAMVILGAGGFTLFLRFIKEAVKANRNEHRFKIFNNVKNETVLF